MGSPVGCRTRRSRTVTSKVANGTSAWRGPAVNIHDPTDVTDRERIQGCGPPGCGRTMTRVCCGRSRSLCGAPSTWLGLSGIGACRGSVGWVSVVWVRLRQSVR
jgi:hypothetical protein